MSRANLQNAIVPVQIEVPVPTTLQIFCTTEGQVYGVFLLHGCPVRVRLQLQET